MQLREWNKKYGPTYGIYEGVEPRIITTDLSIIKDVFLKKFNNFHQRQVRLQRKAPLS